jgi:hypothetical protein
MLREETFVVQLEEFWDRGVLDRNLLRQPSAGKRHSDDRQGIGLQKGMGWLNEECPWQGTLVTRPLHS